MMPTLHLGRTNDGRGVHPPARFFNRHTLIAGSTGTGKTVSLINLCAELARIGTPVFVTDVKGDIPPHLFGAAGYRVDPWSTAPVDLSTMGPDLLSRAMGLTEIQAGVLDIAWQYASDSGLRLRTLADLDSLLSHVDANRQSLATDYGLIGPASIAAIRRAALRLRRAGGDRLFKDSTFQAESVPDGRVCTLDAIHLAQEPALYGPYLLTLLADVYRRAPEIGDTPRPRLAIAIDESHLLFADMPPALLRRFEQIVRLIRSKGVALIFATQDPADIPSAILGQIGTRIQHGMRAATPTDLRSIRVAAESLPANPAIDAGGMIGRLAVGQALVSTIGADGTPRPVELVRMASVPTVPGPAETPDDTPLPGVPDPALDPTPWIPWVVFGAIALGGIAFLALALALAWQTLIPFLVACLLLRRL